MTPPDSDAACRHECQCGYRVIGRGEVLHTHDAVHTWSKCGPPEWTPLMPDSGEREVTHRCTYCGARWRLNGDGTWSLVSGRAGSCCDNVKMGHQIVPLADSERLSVATVEKIERNIAHTISFLGKVGHPQVSLPLSLAQRILAALEESYSGGFLPSSRIAALAAELRALVTK